ncbi:VOC family protein [Flavivirga spongiicola]|uniref:VOC family protein n=1 Tax=Flavivirga spongiicola TaxID=421621 RepID=A0ABU7XSJ4_9FLAO|nr:VOC family protein [Flavivirga sp. MEBiC05379]MDO5977909.1 VOC family protein [Flavivirga sp. MEBiC05379]
MKIKEIILFTANIQKQKQFYQNVLEFELILDLKEKISFKTGASILSFQHDKKAVNASHFAFNIPSNQEQDALLWLQKRVQILPYGHDLISNFTSWNAKAVYFYDSDNNIVEFIARKNLEINSHTSFASKSILSISEIGIVTTNIETVYNSINNMKNIPVFSGNLMRFCALGNDEGLFILINKTLKKWYPTQEEAFTSNFIVRGDYNFSFENGEIKELL